MTALGHALQHLLGVVPGERLVAGVMLAQRTQPLGAKAQQRLGAWVEAFELHTQRLRWAVASGAQVHRHQPGDRTQLAAKVLGCLGQACGTLECRNGPRCGAHGVVGEAAQGQLQLQGQLRAGCGDLANQRQRLVHIAAVLTQQR